MALRPLTMTGLPAAPSIASPSYHKPPFTRYRPPEKVFAVMNRTKAPLEGDVPRAPAKVTAIGFCASGSASVAEIRKRRAPMIRGIRSPLPRSTIISPPGSSVVSVPPVSVATRCTAPPSRRETIMPEPILAAPAVPNQNCASVELSGKSRLLTDVTAPVVNPFGTR